MWIKRDLEKRVKSLAKRFPAVLLTGARQTGKTSLLKHVFPRASFAGFDLPSLAATAETKPTEFLATLKMPVLLDEIQYVPSLFRHLKTAIDSRRSLMGRFLMTGSQKFELMKSISESLAGRCAIVDIEPLSIQEIMRGKSPFSDANILWRGGFPELYRNPNLLPGDYYHSYVASYLERDVRSLLRIGSLRDFERFLRSCALRSGQLLNLTDLARDIGIAQTTAKDWLSVLEASNIITVLEPYFNNLSKRMIKTPKLYLRDSGLLCFLLGIGSASAVLTSPFCGAIWETFILNELIKNKTSSGSSAGIYFWRDAHGIEVDFVIEIDGFLKLVEVKWVEHVERGHVSAPIEKIHNQLGPRAAKEHLIISNTKHEYYLNGSPRILVANGFTPSQWLKL